MKKKTIALLLVMVMIFGISVGGTIAYLTDREAVTNTFTVGNVDIKLDEAKVDENGAYVTDHENRVTENAYHLLPGLTYIKDPTVTVIKGSEDSYVRMIVDVENIDQLKAALPQADNAKYYGADGTFLLQMLCGNWDAAIWEYKNYTESTDGKHGYYEFWYHDVVTTTADADTVLDDLFETITVPGEIDNAHLSHLANVKIIVNAHAIQKAGFDDAAAAWGAWED